MTKIQLVAKAVHELGEHFPNAVVLVRWEEGAETHRIFLRHGNWFACQGMAKDFTTGEDREDLAERIADQIREE